MKLDDLEIYNLSMDLGEKVWAIVIQWKSFEKETVGNQLVRACDSIAANISEGWGRRTYKENRNFLYIARGSLFETKTWITKALRRNMIDSEMFQTLSKEMNSLGVKMNRFIIANNKKVKD